MSLSGKSMPSVSNVNVPMPNVNTLTEFGVFGVVIGVAFWLLTRSDKQLANERDEAHKEVERLAAMLDDEQAAHAKTREMLLDELRGGDE